MTVRMEAQGPVILRWFSGPTEIKDVIDSWEKLLGEFDDMGAYDGVVTSYADAKIEADHENMNEVVDFLRDKLVQLSDMRIAFVLERPLITNTMIIDHEHHRAEVKQFNSEEKAVDWVLGRS